MEKSFSDSRKLSRLSTGPIESTDWENSEKRSRFKQRRRFVHPSQQNSQLPEVYANCIKLCNENKINDQNAFGVDLINYMAKMVQEDDSEMNNFQVASCTLDASAKIYGHRVDHVHSETFKMAGSLGRNQENEAPNNQDKSHGSDNSDAPQKKKKNWKGVRTVANVDTITLGKVSEANEVDPLITLMGEIFSEGYGGECLLSVLTSRDDGGQMTSDYDVPYDHENASVLESRCGSVPDIPVLREMVLESLAGHEICLPTKRFSFRDGDNTEILSDDDMQQDFDIDDNGENSNPIPFPDDGADNDVFDDENVVSSNANSGNVSNAISGFPRVELMEVLSNVPSEASMFSHNFLTAWAGPDHWKITRVKGKAGETMDRKTRKRVAKEQTPINFAEIQNLDDKFAVMKNQFGLRTVQAWKKSKTTFPTLRRYEIKDLAKCYFAQLFTNFHSTGRQTWQANGETDLGSGDNAAPFDNSGCGGFSGDVADDAGTDVPMTCPFDNGDTQQDNFCGDNLVKAPQMVARFNINFSNRAKKINFKRLKHSMWKLLTTREDQHLNGTVHDEMEPNVEQEKLFSQVYDSLQKVLPSKMCGDISRPIAFSCLLHLANERILGLETRDQKDILITKARR